MTKRQAIDIFRQQIRERNADSKFSNQFLYNVLLNHARWLIRREVSGGRIYTNNSLFQTLKCVDVIEVSTIDDCCPIKTDCTIFRTKHKLPEAWIDNAGPILKSIMSVDRSTEFFYTTPTTWLSKKMDPYQKMSKTKYVFFADNYLWFPVHNPHKVAIEGYFIDHVKMDDFCSECENDAPCERFLDTTFLIPGWLEAEMFSKALEQMLRGTLRLQEDEQIDKNVNRKN